MKLLKLLAPAVFSLAIFSTLPARADAAADGATNTEITDAQINQLLQQVSGNDPLSQALKILVQQTQQYLRQVNVMMSEQDGTAASTGAATVVSKNAQACARPSAANRATPEVHLAGYPALPEVSPTSSMPSPTDIQLAAGAEVNRKINARKRFFMELTGAVQPAAQ